MKRKKQLKFKLIVVFIDKIDYNSSYRNEKEKQGRILAFKYTDGWALCGGAPRPMSGGDPSSIKRYVLCDAVSLFVRIFKRKATVWTACLAFRLSKGRRMNPCIRCYTESGDHGYFLM